jgi:hypothetical protein
MPTVMTDAANGSHLGLLKTINTAAKQAFVPARKRTKRDVEVSMSPQQMLASV